MIGDMALMVAGGVGLYALTVMCDTAQHILVRLCAGITWLAAGLTVVGLVFQGLAR